MDSKVYIHTILLCVVNVIFICAGMFLNILVIVSFWKSSAYLRNKLCNFMIMVLSCFDFLVVITNHPVLMLRLIFWSTEKYDLLARAQIYEHFSNLFIGFSIMVLLVISIERYLGAYYPIFHRTSLTRRRLLILLAILFIVPIILIIISVNDMVISFPVVLGIYFVIVFPPFAFLNYKFKISKKMRRDIAGCGDNTTSPDGSPHGSPDVSALHVKLKNISTCLLAVGCLLLMYIPAFIYIAFNLAEKSTAENTRVAKFWTSTVANANSTLNCLIFFWKNDVLRKEGVKMLKSLKNRLKCTCYKSKNYNIYFSSALGLSHQLSPCKALRMRRCRIGSGVCRLKRHEPVNSTRAVSECFTLLNSSINRNCKPY